MVKKPSTLPRSFLSLRRLLWRSISGGHYRRSTTARAAPAVPAQEKLRDRTVLVDVEGWLLRSPLSTFPYFMLVAIEAGSFLRGLLLLLMYPVLRLLALLSLDLCLKAMVMVSLFGLREKEVARISKAVLPKYFLEDVTNEGLEAFNDKAGKVVAVTASFPRVMVEAFLKEYLGVHAVVGREVTVAAGHYIGLLEEEHAVMKRVEAFLEEMEEMRSKGDGAVGLVRAASWMHHVISRYCKVSLSFLLLRFLDIVYYLLNREKKYARTVHNLVTKDKNRARSKKR